MPDVSQDLARSARADTGPASSGDAKLSLTGMAVTSGLLWGGGVLAVGLINLARPRYARRFLEMMSSVYPGYHGSRRAADVLVGTAYATLDGATAGLLFAWLYNRFSHRRA
jgi:hypothetical protein